MSGLLETSSAYRETWRDTSFLQNQPATARGINNNNFFQVAVYTQEWQWRDQPTTRTTSRCSGRQRRIGGVSGSARKSGRL